jgi:acyl carrier protein
LCAIVARLDRKTIHARVVRAIRASMHRATPPRPDDSLVLDLGFDSLRISTLMISLESEFGQPLLLIEWVSRVEDPTELTVASLCDYIEELLDQR